MTEIKNVIVRLEPRLWSETLKTKLCLYSSHSCSPLVGFFLVTLLRYVLRVFLCPRRNRFSTPPTFNYRTGSIPGINKRVGETTTTRLLWPADLRRCWERDRERDLPSKKSGISSPGFRDDLFIFFFFFFFETHLSPTTSSWIHPVEHSSISTWKKRKTE